MRHLKSGRKLGRTSAHRKALFNNLARALVKYELIQTTDAKAKELRRVTDKLITLGKQDTLHARRQAFRILKDRDLVGKLFDDLAKREPLVSRQGGYTRILKVGTRRGDNALMTRVSWMGSDISNTISLRYPDYMLDQFETAQITMQSALPTAQAAPLTARAAGPIAQEPLAQEQE